MSVMPLNLTRALNKAITISIHICSPKQKNYNTKVVENGEIDLLVKGNFKRSTECDEFDTIRLKIVRTSVQN